MNSSLSLALSRLAPSLLLTMATLLGAETVKDREGAVRQDRAKLEKDARWNYNDIEGGFRLAQSTGKPLLVVLRCVPCVACVGIDAMVLEEKELMPLLDQFVCVRVTNANALDLTRFQFDYDLSFSAMLFNGDGTVYGRYGSWLHQKEPLNRTTTGLRKALEAALAIHRDYPANKPALAGKQGEPGSYKTTTDLPKLSGKYQSKLDWDGKVVQSCVHCHMIGDAIRADYRSQGSAVPLKWIFPQPSLETIGATLATDEIATVTAVQDGSPAATAGLQAGDQLLSLEKQPLVSLADVSWVLHRAPDTGSLSAAVRRSGRESTVPLMLELPAGWRTQSDISKRVGTWPMRAMAFGGMKMEDLDNTTRSQLGLGMEEMALRIKHVGQFGMSAAAKKQGFKVDDIVLQAGSLKTRFTEGALIGELLQRHRPGELLPALVLRGTDRVELKLPQQ